MSSSQTTFSWLANQPMQRKIMMAIGMLLSLFVLAGLITLKALQQESLSRQQTSHTYDVQLQLSKIVQIAQASQIGARGYLLTQQPEELQDFQRANGQLAQAVEHLRALTADNPLQQLRLQQLDALSKQWQQQVEQSGVVAMRNIRATDPTARALEERRLQIDAFRHRVVKVTDMVALLDQMAATERLLLTQRNDALDKNIATVRAIAVASLILSVLLGIGLIWMTFRLITRPLQRMTELMTRLANHDHSIVIHQLHRRDEIGAIARALHVFKQMAIETRGKTWVKSSTSTITSKLQAVTDYRQFADLLTSELVPLLQAGIGVFYQYDEDSQRLALLGSYGYKQRRHIDTSYALGEGLVGQCAIERKPIVLQQVPDDYTRIHSGTGEAVPRSVTVLPLVLRERLLGVLELASFNHLNELQQHLLDELLPIVALSLENLGRALRTQALLQQTQEQANELRHSEEVLRRHQDDLTATNETLHARTIELQEQSQRLLASEEELRVQTEELQASNEELRQKGDILNQQKHVLEALQHETQEKAEELARASQYKSEFLANMSHELRTPLNSLLILSRSLADNREGNLDDEQIESARIIYDSGSSLLRLINDILDLSKVEAGKMELLLGDYPLVDLERTLKRTFNPVAQEKQLSFTVTIAPGLPAAIRTDAAKLEQIANNLIGNAFKFTSEGGVRVDIARPAATLALPQRLLGTPLLAIAVSDTGIGIASNKHNKVFHAFEQVDASTSRQYGGTGLGLTISRRIAELLGGDLLLDSEAGRGSVFTIVLPELAADTALEPSVHARHDEPPTSVRLPSSSALLPDTIDDDRAHLAPGDTVILIVEDDPVFARILADMVHRKGYRVLAAGDGESGLQLALRYRPTGILLDVMLPGMDGWTVIDRLKSEPGTRHIPVHFISAVDEASRGRELGAVGFLTKPVSREAIGGAFERLLHFAEGRTRHLLIVDDDADARAAVRTLLRHDGVVIDEAGSGEEALTMVLGNDYDCVVLDLGLPGMSGNQLLERLADSGRIPPVVVYSGRELSREESLQLRQYTDSIVVKGARSPERLMDEVSLFLHSMRSGGGAASVNRGIEHTLASDPLRDRKVLLVDDDMRNLFALSKVLRGWGMQVTMAQDGQKALKTLAEDGGNELVLMDIMMPVMDGYDTIRAIRAQPTFARLPIIALTAKAMRGDREKCLEAGASDYLSKPIDIDKLASMMRVWLHR